MAITKLHLVYFSPSGTTEKTVRTIASGIEGLPVDVHNLLPYESRRKEYTFGPNDLVIMGTMTAGKLFTLSDELFACLEAEGTPFIGAVTYGNEYYGISLTEMNERAEGRGFRVLALGAFPVQHSSVPEFGTGRPDEKDKEIMRDFGRKAWGKVQAGDYELHNVPGTNWSGIEEVDKLVAYREAHRDEQYEFPREWKKKEITDDCIKCRTCVRNCPTNAINIETKTFDLDKCIACWACINRCPKHAIISISPQRIEIANKFMGLFTKRLESEIFM